MSHTPGPWHAYEQAYSTHNHPTRYWETALFGPTGELIGNAAGATEDEANANAHFIAAAPELLEALKACHLQMLQSDNQTEYAQEANQMAIAAIAKAKGGAQ